ncbi:MAG: HIT domain-containing protein [Deltaproteobacteria bacterium]|nr:HIT domain-containing protein [Deltaproteobacteria bacterium]
MTKVIWAPWRMEYILSEKPGECILCLDRDETNDRKRLIVYRSSRSFVMLNRYPYNNGHLMIAPFTHCANIEDLDPETSLDMFGLVQKAIRIMKECLQPEGFNIGINLGRVGGAGVEEHLHIHIVPRWNGDTNFMAVISDVRVMPEHLEDSYNKLRPYFQELDS